MSQSPLRKFPKLLRHKAKNRAYVMVRQADGQRRAVYFGTWGSPEAQA